MKLSKIFKKKKTLLDPLLLAVKTDIESVLVIPAVFADGLTFNQVYSIYYATKTVRKLGNPVTEQDFSIYLNHLVDTGVLTLQGNHYYCRN
ncbi:MAG: hypothetical protein ACTSRU_12880 [Candidatus Hodarchaeales archaeon]